jgi:hypothetical protein
MSWVGHVARTGAKKNTYRILAGKPEEKRRLGRPKSMWEDNIKMALEVKDGEEWTELISLGTVTTEGLLLTLQRIFGSCKT